MAASENELLVRAAIVDELSGGLAVIDEQVKKLTADVAKLDVAGAEAAAPGRGGLSRMSGVGGELAKMAKNAHTELLSMSDAVRSTFATGLKVGVEAAGVLAIGIGILGYKAFTSMQTARVGVETFVGSVSKGDAVFAQLKNLQGPFNITNLQEAAQAMLTAGGAVDHVIPRMKVLADIAATQADPAGALNTLADALNRIQESGVVDARTIRPLLTAGVPIYEMLGTELGVSPDQVKKTLASGAPLDLPVRFFADLEAEAGPLAKFKGALQTQESTLKGQMQQTKVTVTNALADVFQPIADSLSPVFPALRRSLDSLIRGVGPQFTTFVTGIVGLLAGLLPILQPIAASLLGAVGQVLLALVPALAQLAPTMPALADALARMVIAIIPLIPPLTTLTVALVPVLVTAINALTRGITLSVSVLGPIIDKFAGWVNESAALRDVLAAVLVGLLAYRTVSTVVETVVALAQAFGRLRAALVGVEGAEAAGTAVSGGEGVAALTAGTGLAAFGAVAGWAALALAIGAAVYGLDQWLNKGRLTKAVNGSSFDLGVGNPGSTPTERAAEDAAAQASSDAWLKNQGSGKIPATDPQFGDAFSSSKPKNTSDGTGYTGTMTNEQRDQYDTDLARQGWEQDAKTGKLIPIDVRRLGQPLLPNVNVTAHVYGEVDLSSAVTAGIRKAQQQMDERK